MSAAANLPVQINGAMLVARLHRTHALRVADQAQEIGSEPAWLTAGAAVEYADKALLSLRDAPDLLPDTTEARDAKLRGDVIVLESGSSLMTARQLPAAA